MKNITIIGAGPTGLFIAILLSKLGHKCTVIDKNHNIGGCHRVIRDEGILTEHGPRIYMDNYVNFIQLLNMLNIDFYKIFKKYKYKFPGKLKELLNILTIRELLIFQSNYLLFMINPSYFKKISLEYFTNKYNFSKKSKKFINNICKLTEASNYDRYSCYKFFSLPVFGFWYNLYMPSKPTDIELWELIYRKMKKLNIKFKSNTEIKYVNYNNINPLQFY